MPIFKPDTAPQYVGCVVSEYERDGYHDSDFYATVWDGSTFRTIEWGTTRCAAGPQYGYNCQVDATPEVLAAYDAWRNAQYTHFQNEKHRRERRNPTKGKSVRSLTTRGKAKGQKGVIFWRGANQFRTYYGYNKPEHLHNQVVGFKTNEGEKFFVSADRCCVIDLPIFHPLT